MWFNRRRDEEDMARGQDIEDRYSKDLASWQIEHDTNRKDMTPEQDERYRFHNRVANAGLDPIRITYGQLLVRKGVVSDGD